MKTISILATVNVDENETIGGMILALLSTLNRPIAKKAALSLNQINETVKIISLDKEIGEISLYSVEDVVEVDNGVKIETGGIPGPFPTIVKVDDTPTIVATKELVSQ